MVIKIMVAKINKGCKVFKEGEVFSYKNHRIFYGEKTREICSNAEKTLLSNIDRIKVQQPIYISCLEAGITTENCGNVIFKIYKDVDK